MDRATRERRAPRRVLSVLATIGLVTALLAVLAPGADAVVNTCKARNLTKDTPVDTNLQRVIKAASPGDTIAVKYVCVGNFTIAKTLTLLGRATPGMAKAVLNANGAGRPLQVVMARVRLINLKVTGGLKNAGGGIYNDSGTVTLKDTVVRGNTASNDGGGIYNYAGTVTLKGSSSVSGNTADQRGGGIFSYAGTVALKNSSSVSGNTASQQGGGIFNTFATAVVGCDATGVDEWIGTVEPNTPNDFLDSDVTLITCT